MEVRAASGYDRTRATHEARRVAGDAPFGRDDVTGRSAGMRLAFVAPDFPSRLERTLEARIPLGQFLVTHLLQRVKFAPL